MPDRPDRQPERRESEQASGSSALEQVRRQIWLHEKHEKKQSLLARGVSFFLRTDSSSSLAELKELYGQAKELEKSNDQKDKQKLVELEKQLVEKARNDRQAMQWQEETNSYGTGFLKTMGIFMKGRAGLGVTALSFGLDQVKLGDGLGLNAVDFGLGVGKGMLTRKVLGAVSGKQLGIATEAFTIGISSRVLDDALTRENYFDPANGRFNFSRVLTNIDQKALDRTALASDLAVFGGGHLFFGVGNRMTGGGLGRSRFLGTVFTGGAFGVASGSSSEIIRQHQSGESLDLTKIARHAVVQGVVDTVAASPGGLQADPLLRASLSARLRTSMEWLRSGNRVRTEPAQAVNSGELKFPEIKVPEDSAAKQEVTPPVEKAQRDREMPIANPDLTPTGRKRRDSGRAGNDVETGSRIENPARDNGREKVSGGEKTEPASGRVTSAEPLLKPPDRTVLIHEGASRDVIARLSDPQVSLILKMHESVRAYFLGEVLRNPASSPEMIGRAIIEADTFSKQPLSGQVHDAEKEFRSLQQRLGTDARKPLSAEEMLRLDRASDLFRSRLGLALEEAARSNGTVTGETANDAQALFRKKVTDILDRLDIGNMNTLMGGNAQEIVVLKEMRDAIKRAGVGDDVRIVRLLGDHAADHCGFDFVLVNVKTGKMLPVDPTERNKFDDGLPAIRKRNVVSVPDPTRADIAQLWEHIREQQGIPASTAMPSVPEMLKLRCDYILRQLADSPLKVTDVRLFFDDFIDRQQFSRKVTDADRSEVAGIGAGRRSFVQLAGGELVDPTFVRTRTLSPGLSYAKAIGTRLSRALAVPVGSGGGGGMHEAGLDAPVAARLETSARLIERQTDVIARFVEDLRKLSRKVAPTDRRASSELNEYANHTENGALAYFTGASSTSPAQIARSIREILGQ